MFQLTSLVESQKSLSSVNMSEVRNENGSLGVVLMSKIPTSVERSAVGMARLWNDTERAVKSVGTL